MCTCVELEGRETTVFRGPGKRMQGGLRELVLPHRVRLHGMAEPGGGC